MFDLFFQMLQVLYKTEGHIYRFNAKFHPFFFQSILSYYNHINFLCLFVK